MRKYWGTLAFLSIAILIPSFPVAAEESSIELRIEIDALPGQVVDPTLENKLMALEDETILPEGSAGLNAGSTRTIPGGITIEAIDTVPDSIVDVLESAVSQWDTTIERNGAPLDIKLHYINMGPSVLAAAGPYMLTRGGVETPVALINAEAGYDTAPGLYDIVVYVNSARTWNLSVSSTPPSTGDFILRTVLLHELGHGFGIISGYSSTDNGSQTPTSFDESFHFAKTTPLHGSFNSTYQTSNNVWIRNTDSTWEKIHAPSTWRTGSSLSHLGEYDYLSGSDGALMTPALAVSESIYQIDAITGGLLSQVGWDVKKTPAAPNVVDKNYDNGIFVQIAPNLNVSSIPAASYNYKVLTSSGTTIRTGSLDAETSSAHYPNDFRAAKLSGYLPDGVYTVKLSAQAAPGYVSSETTTLVDVFNPRPIGWRPDLTDQVDRLYRAYFLRDSDLAGLIFWSESMADGTSLNSVSSEFASSSEFINRYGSLSDTQFVTLVYSNVLGRAPDSAGLLFWNSQLNTGMTRGQMMVGFSESPEFINLSLSSTPLSSSSSKVWRLYAAVLGRSADNAGLNYWTEQQATLGTKGVADLLVSSPEFVLKYGRLTDTQFINQLYLNVLARPADSAGLDYWNGVLGEGAERSDVVIGFSESTEFILRTNTIR